MKTTIKLFRLGLVSALAFSSCSDSFLEEKKNYDNVNKDVYNYYEGCDGRVNDIYSWCLPTTNDLTWKCPSMGNADEAGKATAYALGQLEDRGVMFIEPGTEVYEGMIVGECNRENDLAVNVVKGKQLTNTRASGSDHTVVLKRPRPLTLEYCLDYINTDELVEITPENIRLRKFILNTEARKKFDAKK